MADFTERQLLEIAVTGTEKVEASARAFLGVDEAISKAAAKAAGWKGDVSAWGESAGAAASKTYELSTATNLVASSANDAAKAFAAETAAQKALAQGGYELANSVAIVSTKTTQANATIDFTTKAAGKASLATHDFRQNITALGYGFNDFFSVSGNLQQRLNSISNNMPGILAGFGYWGLALSAILPIIGMVLPELDRLAKALGFPDAPKHLSNTIEILKAKLKELEDRPLKMSVDVRGIKEAQAALDKFQHDVEKFRQLEAMRTEAQQKSAAAVNKVLQEAKGPDLAKKLKDAEAERLGTTDPIAAGAAEDRDKAKAKADAILAHMRELARDHPVAGLPAIVEQGKILTAERAKMRAAEDRRKTRMEEIGGKGGDAESAVGKALDAAEKGDPSALAKKLGAVGRDDMASDLEATTPAAMKGAEKARRAIQQFLDVDLPAAIKQVGEDLALRRHDKAVGDAMRRADATMSKEDDERLLRRKRQEFEEKRERDGFDPGARFKPPAAPPRDPKDFNVNPNVPPVLDPTGKTSMTAPGGPTGLMGAMASTLMGAMATVAAKIPRFAGVNNAGKTTEQVIQGQVDADTDRNQRARIGLMDTVDARDKDAAARQRAALDRAAGGKPIGPHGAGGVRGGRQGRNAAALRAAKGQTEMRAKAKARADQLGRLAAKKSRDLMARQNKFNVRPAQAGGGMMMGPKPGQGLRGGQEAGGQGDVVPAIDRMTNVTQKGQQVALGQQQALGAALARIAQLEANVAALMGNNRRLMRVAMSRSETALTSGNPGG